jgi:Na+-driven multidrug efflux pump
MLLSPLLFPIAYNADAVESAQIFNVYLLILSSRILMPQVVIMSHQKNYFLVVSAIVEIAINVVLSLILVKVYGLVGIAFASVIAYLVDKILLIIYSHQVLKTPVTKYVSIGKYFFYNGLLFASYLAAEAIY